MLRLSARKFILITGLSALSGTSIAQVCIEKAANNTSCGTNSLLSITSGAGNIAMGDEALLNNMTGNYNSAAGYLALDANITGTYNAGFGAATLQYAQGAMENTALGTGALRYDTSGANNTAAGFTALYNNQTGTGNTAIGNRAGVSLVSGSNNTYVGNGVSGASGENYVTRIGVSDATATTYIAGISNTPVTGSPVYVTSNGQLGTGPASSAGGPPTVQDSTGKVIGPYVYFCPVIATACGADYVLVRAFGTPFVIGFTANQLGATPAGSGYSALLYFTSANCSGTPYLSSGNNFAYGMPVMRVALVGNSTAYLLGTTPMSINAVASFSSISPGAPNGPCTPTNNSAPPPVVPVVATYDLSTLNLAPPFSVN